ncbi:MAG: YIP1 family protein [Candidatus Niameybacter stercoravium]|nr:YIP1 family protein [Candidatus Niameybacter stercoravium]
METLKALKYATYIMGRPFDGFWDLKHEKRGNLKAAMILVVVTMLTFILLNQNVGFLFGGDNPLEFNIIIEACSVLVPFLLWCSSNWCLTTLMDGKGTFKEIFIATAYSLAPIVIIYIPTIILTNVVTLEESVFCIFLFGVANIWFAVLLVIGTMCTHHYTMGKTILTCLLTIVGMGIMIFIGLLFFNLIEQMIMFASTLYKEIIFRL